MCLNPILIKNPNYRHTVKNSYDVYSHMKDTTSQYIEVKCGHCPECAALKQTYIRQRAALMAKTHDIYFTTLTYKESMLPRMDVNGFSHAYADIHDFQTMVKYMRKINFFGKPFKYIAVTEYGGERHRPHFHILWFVPKDNSDAFDAFNKTQFYYWALLKLWRRNVTSVKTSDTAKKRIRVNTRKAKYENLCDYKVSYQNGKKRCTYDFHHVIPRRTKNGVLDVTTYVTKYCLKFDDWIIKKQQALHLNLEYDEYKRVWQAIKPRILISKNFGNDKEFESHVRKGIDSAIINKQPYFVFIDPQTGKESPLSPYLRKYFATIQDKIDLYLVNEHSEKNIIPLSDDYKGYALRSRKDKCNRIKQLILARNSDDFYELE